MGRLVLGLGRLGGRMAGLEDQGYGGSYIYLHKYNYSDLYMFVFSLLSFLYFPKIYDVLNTQLVITVISTIFAKTGVRSAYAGRTSI